MLKPEKKIQNQQFMRKYAHKKVKKLELKFKSYALVRKQEISPHQNFGSFPPLWGW